MKMIRSLALGILSLAAASIGAIPGAADEPAEAPQVATGPLVPRWNTQAILDTSRDHARHVVHDETVTLVQSSAGVVTAMNSENGRKLWARQVGRNDEASLPAGTSSQYALLITGPVVHALDKFTGDELFTYRLPRQPTVGPAVSEGSFYIPLFDGSVCGFSIHTLSHYEKFGTLPAGVAKPMAWRFVANEPILQPPVVGSETVAFATEKGNVHGVHSAGTSGGQSLYQLLVRSPIVVPMSVARTETAEYLLFATDDDVIFCVELFNGRMIWNWPMGRPITERMVVVGDDVYVVTEGEGITQLSLSGGRPGVTSGGRPWEVPGVRSIAAVSASRLYGVDRAMQLVVVDRRSADVLDRLPLGEDTHVVSNALTDRVYLYNSSGRVRCFAEEGSEFATYHQHPERQPVMPAIPDSDPAEAAGDDVN